MERKRSLWEDAMNSLCLLSALSLAKARDSTASRERLSPEPPGLMVTWFWERSSLCLLKLNICILHDTAISSNRNTSVRSSKIMYMIIHSNTMHDSLKLEITPMTTSRRMDKVIMVYSYNVILYINKNEGITATCVDMDESRHCSIEWRKWGTEDSTFHPSIYMFQKQVNPIYAVKSQESSNEWIKKCGT